MAKNILIISSDHTGHGHKSITDSLVERFAKYPDIKVHVIDGFSMGGSFGLKMGKIYGPITRNARYLWKLIWDISIKNPSFMRNLSRRSIHDKFLEVVDKIKPDIILAVHPGFVGSVIDILEENHINIPLLSLVPDLISISPLWADRRALYTLCPTQEALERCMKFGVPRERLKLVGFPVREKFCSCTSEIAHGQQETESRLKCLIMSGGEGSGNMGRLAETLLKNFDCSVKIITGRNIALKKKLENLLSSRYPGRVEILGFTENVQDLMADSHLAITRGSPNVMMEAVTCNVPLIVTGALPGQEEENPTFLLKHNLGVVCTDKKKLSEVVSRLLENKWEKLNQIKESQRKYRNTDAASYIVNFIKDIDAGNDTSVQASYSELNLA
ncbi:MAG: glycosyltransferase [Bacillota bacterium]|nr:glycosyltransferase [Bacillota bacterium]